MKYLTGEIKRPDSTNIGALLQWNFENSMVDATLINPIKHAVNKKKQIYSKYSQSTTNTHCERNLHQSTMRVEQVESGDGRS